MIPWRPIAELPDELKDGREVLIAYGRTMAVAGWCKAAAEEDYNDGVGWRDAGDMGYPVDHEAFDEAKAKLGEAP